MLANLSAALFEHKRITTTVTLERSARDEFFGFGKRPRPFTLLGE